MHAGFGRSSDFIVVLSAMFAIVTCHLVYMCICCKYIDTETYLCMFRDVFMLKLINMLGLLLLML